MSGQGQKLLQAQMAAYQPEEFSFTAENEKRAKAIVAKYPKGKQQSGLLPLLSLAQEQHSNWLPVAAMEYVADWLEIPRMRAYEVATFYTMYNLQPVGRHMIEVCTTTPCWLRGSDDIVSTCKKELGVEIGETSADGMFTLKEAECLAACVNAPMVQIGNHYYEDLTSDSIRKIIEDLRAGREPQAGTQSGRKTCAPSNGFTTLQNGAPAPVKHRFSKAEDKKAKAAKKDKPNTPSEDEPKAKHKDVRHPAVDTVPTTEDAKNGKAAKKGKSSAVESNPGKARKTELSDTKKKD